MERRSVPFTVGYAVQALTGGAGATALAVTAPHGTAHGIGFLPSRALPKG